MPHPSPARRGARRAPVRISGVRARAPGMLAAAGAFAAFWLLDPQGLLQLLALGVRNAVVFCGRHPLLAIATAALTASAVRVGRAARRGAVPRRKPASRAATRRSLAATRP